MTIRNPAVSGQFYPGQRLQLTRAIKDYVDEKAKKEEVIGAVLPHAGYIYSGPVAGATVSRILFKKTFIILGPNHTGHGKPYAIETSGAWRTPLGDVKIDEALAKDILNKSDHLKEDERAHLYEHSIEVEIPFLQYFQEDFEIIPICVVGEDGAILKKIGLEIASSIKALKKDVVIIASSDMTHYEPQADAERKDKEAIDAILKLDVDGLLNKVFTLGITMCGYGPTAIMLSAAKELGAKSAELVKYQTSGDITGDYDQVVGYAGIIVKGGRR